MTLLQKIRLWAATKRARRHIKTLIKTRHDRRSKSYVGFHKQRYHEAAAVAHSLNPDCRLPLWIM